MKNILIPTDFSENAWNAIRYGMELFKKRKCVFYLMHVTPISAHVGEAAMYSTTEMPDEELLRESRKGLERLVEDIGRLPLNTRHSFQSLSHYGYFSDLVKYEVGDKNIDLIIMGTKGASGLKAITIGSNTANVLTKVKCPVLAVPENAKFTRPREIAFPTDYNLNYGYKVLDGVKELAAMNQATLRLLHVIPMGMELTTSQEQNKQFLNNYFSDTAHSFHQLSGEKIETAVQCFTESRDIDMIVMVAKNLNFLQRILFKPTVEKISYHTKIPFFIFHE